MGTLHAAGTVIATDDHTLAHLAAIITTKLRRHEPFLLTFPTADGRDAIWLHSAANLHFTYDGPEHPTLDRALLESMHRDANRPTGLALPLTPAPASRASRTPAPNATA